MAARLAFVLQVPFAVGGSLLLPVSRAPPDRVVFPLPDEERHLPPFGTEVLGAKSTNKFWANWVVEEGRDLPIHPMPYVLRYDESEGLPNMKVSRADEKVLQYGDAETNGANKIRYYFSPFVSEFGLSAVECAGEEGQIIVKEGLFGVHAEVRGPVGTQRKILFPIYSGMSYVSGFYSGFTPKISSDRALLVIERVSNGIWKLLNTGGKEFRLYAIDSSGSFADDSFDFHQGTMQKAFEGWIRLAEVQAPADRDILDFHAPAVLVDWDLDVESGGIIKYAFTKHAAVPKQILHFAYAHHEKLLTGNTQVVTHLKPLTPPTKGQMKGVTGDLWQLQANCSEANQLGFLPAREPDSSKWEDLKDKARGTLQFFLHSDQWKQAMFRGSYYFSGKGFQKVAYTCLLLEKFYGTTHRYTQSCANLLQRGFECLYQPRVPECNGAPMGLYYDAAWHGVASREGFTDKGCRTADFGNACYNDHHYHFSYFVVSAAVLVKLKPEFARHDQLVSFVDTLIRDTTNPSLQDLHFPRFRSFDWFELHSWSRGVIPSADGKDQESTSEELNLLYGIHLWGTVLHRESLQQLGSTMLTVCALTIREYFLMTEDNPHHPKDFVRNHATGIFFQNKVDYATWFGWRYDFIHGIQMLPLTPALLMIRTPRFCRQEWDNILSHLPLSLTDPWTSLVLAGTLAIIDPEEAYRRLSAMLPEHMDDGLTWAWALYWTATQPSVAVESTTRASSTGNPTVASEENVALYRLAFASSELSADFAAARAVDGLFVTRWSPKATDERPWIAIDLGETKALSHIVVLCEFYPSSYRIQGKVDGDWNTLAVAVGSSELQRTALPQPTWAREVRLLLQGAVSADLRLWELQVFEDTFVTVKPSSTASGTTATSVELSTTMPEATSSAEPSTTSFYGPNLAFQKPVLASSFRSASEHAYKAVDGEPESQWASVALNHQWLWVDLLGLYAVTRVVVLGDASEFVLETAPDGIKWTTVASTGSSAEFTPPILTQWLRVVCPTACSIRELTVHGDEPEPSGTTESTTRVNLALLRPVLASSQRLPEEHVSRMTDGVLNTHWTSAVGDQKPWAWVDLLGVYQVAEVQVLWGSPMVASYALQCSLDAITWTLEAEVLSVNSKKPTVTTFLEPVKTQWIRIVCSSLSGPTCSIKELLVYNAAQPSPSAAGLALRAVGPKGPQWSSGDQWISVDLLSKYQLDSVVILWGRKATSFILETSLDAIIWEEAVNLPRLWRLDVPAQWIRVTCDCSIRELQVYGTKVAGRILTEEVGILLV